MITLLRKSDLYQVKNPTMKFSVAVALLFIVSSTVAIELAEEYYYTQAANYLEDCYQKIGLIEGNDSPLTVQQEKCGIACMFTAFKLMNEDGSINVEKVLENSKDLTVEKLNEYVKSCEKEGGFNAQSPDYSCEIAACFHKNDYFLDVETL